MEALKKTLRTWRWKPGLIASEVLDHPSKYMIKPISAQRRVWTKKRYKEHMEHLEKAGILQRLEHPNECSFFSSYFSVPKTSICDRAIFNGKALSTLFKAPPPVNLAQTRDVLTRLQNLAYEHDNLYVAVGDFRHWFSSALRFEEVTTMLWYCLLWYFLQMENDTDGLELFTIYCSGDELDLLIRWYRRPLGT